MLDGKFTVEGGGGTGPLDPPLHILKLPLMLKYCSMYLDTYNAQENTSIIYLGLTVVIPGSAPGLAARY